MIQSIAILPQPPLLVPELVGAASTELQPLRTACLRAVTRLRRHWYAVGVDGSGPACFGSDVRGSFRGYGADVPVSLTDRPAEHAEPTTLPLPLLVAGWLRGQAGAHSVASKLVHPSTSPAACLTCGQELAGRLNRDLGARWSILVLADGASTHATPGAGRVDNRAQAFDAAVAAALAAVDVDALAAIEPELSTALGARGRAAWQVLAGVVVGSGADWAGELLYSAAPYGVGYHVALWTTEDGDRRDGDRRDEDRRQGPKGAA